ncbi:hypothetical protein [Haladaptatus sp. NG-WS-4]
MDSWVRFVRLSTRNTTPFPRNAGAREVDSEADPTRVAIDRPLDSGPPVERYPTLRPSRVSATRRFRFSARDVHIAPTVSGSQKQFVGRFAHGRRLS